MEFILPPNENVLAWELALSLGGFEAGDNTTGARVELIKGPVWEIRVIDAAGMVRSATVSPPQSQQDREDIVLLAASLMMPLNPRDAWTMPATRPPQAPTVPVFTWVTPPRMETGGAPALPPGVVHEVPRSLPDFMLFEVLWDQGPWLAISQSVSFRQGFEPQLAQTIRSGYRFNDVFSVTGGISYLPANPMVDRPEISMRDIVGEAGGYLSLLPSQWWAGRLGIFGGIAYRTFWNDYGQQSVWVGSLGGELSWVLPITGPVSLAPFVGLRGEIPGAKIEVDEEFVSWMGAVEVRGGLTIHLQLKPRVVARSPDRFADLEALPLQ